MQAGDSLSHYTELRIHAVFPEDVLNILNINISGQNVLLDRQGSGDTGGLSHVDADGHNTEIGMSHMCAGDIAASQQQTVNRFGNQTAIGDRVSLGFMLWTSKLKCAFVTTQLSKTRAF